MDSIFGLETKNEKKCWGEWQLSFFYRDDTLFFANQNAKKKTEVSCKNYVFQDVNLLI